MQRAGSTALPTALSLPIGYDRIDAYVSVIPFEDISSRNKQMFDMSITVLGVGTDAKQNKPWSCTQGVH